MPSAGGAFAFMDPFELTRALVALETPTGSEQPAIDLLDGLLRRGGYRTVRQPVTPGRDNLYAYRERPELVFSTHVDTVPPHLPVMEDDAAIRGRGTCDAKGLAAAMVAAADRLAEAGERRVGLLFLVGEENGSDGARAAADFGPRGRFLINGEPTENRLSVGQKGTLRVDLTATGRAAHSAYPDEGSSAIAALLDTIERIRRLSSRVLAIVAYAAGLPAVDASVLEPAADVAGVAAVRFGAAAAASVAKRCPNSLIAATSFSMVDSSSLPAVRTASPISGRWARR